jgi:hypothetical protein
MANMIKSKDNSDFLSSFDVSVTKNPLFIVPIHPENSIENVIE